MTGRYGDVIEASELDLTEMFVTSSNFGPKISSITGNILSRD